ncbi:hypothetical protein [Lichenibacterium dinghuense]|uniref:hypothetical protein n=1 Tax=Lichenibacterium dinghuense TaxID=2895977 RepID=UPI001F21DA83|nr:hypothetical protein [Lichenibacterium sp. 6Y81]
MAHTMFDVALTARMGADAMGAATAQASRMVRGAVALRDAQVRAADARQGRAAAEDRLAASTARLACARAARAAARAS